MVAIRPAQASDLPAISALDVRLTGSDKPDYWRDMLAPERNLLVAENDGGRLLGFIAGEVRAWEFGQPAAGWVFAIQIEPKQRERGVASALFEALVARSQTSILPSEIWSTIVLASSRIELNWLVISS